MCVLLRFVFLFTFPYSTEKQPTDDRARSDTTPCLQKVLFLKIAFLKRLTHILKLLTIFLKRFTPFLKRFTPSCAFRAHLLLCFTPNKHKKCTFPQKKCIFLYILTSFSSLPYYLCRQNRKTICLTAKNYTYAYCSNVTNSISRVYEYCTNKIGTIRNY